MAIRLPYEIIITIVREVDDVTDLGHLRLVSHALCATATPFTFRTLSVNTTERSAQKLGRLFNLPVIAAHVREVSYYDGGNRRGTNLTHVNTKVFQKVICDLASSFSRIHQLPQLEAINLTFHPADSDWPADTSDNNGRVALQESILGALALSFSVRALPKLMFLSLHNLHTWHLSPLESAPFQTILTTLRRLQMSVLFESAPDPFTFTSRWSHFWSTLSPQMILSPTQHTLTELTLHSDAGVDASSGLSLAGLHFPHLCALSLRNLSFQPSTGVETFILRHGATLARLELLSCQMTILGGTEWHRYLYPSTTISQGGESSSGPDGWHLIWNRFEAELTALVTLHVACPNDPRIPLCAIRPGEYNAVDIAALRRFRNTVAARSQMSRES